MTLVDGTYRIAVTMADGRRVWRRARSQRAAERIRRELVDERDLDLDPGRRTLADWLRSWIAELADARNAGARDYIVIAADGTITAVADAAAALAAVEA